MSEETLTKEEAKAAAEALKILSQNVQSEEEEGMSVWDAARMVFQGASFGTSDEIYGSIKGAIDPTMTAQEGRDEQRRLLADTKREYPKTSIALEAGGAVGTGLLAAPFTGGGSLGAGLTRAAAVGAAEGLAYGMGTSEGNIGERVLGGADEALIGVFVNPILQKTLGLLRPAARKVLTETARKMRGAQVSSKAEQELIRIIDESGVNPNDSGEVTELLEQIADGKILADISESARNALRAVYSQMGGNAREKLIGQVLVKRADEFTSEAESSIQNILAPGSAGGNIAIAVNSNLDEITAAASKEYKNIFEVAPKIIRGTDDDLIDAVQMAVNRSDEGFKEIQDILKAEGLPSVFNVNKKTGLITVKDSITLEQAEIVYRGIRDLAGDVKTKPTLKKALKGVVNQLKTEIDNYSPELASVRAKWAAVSNSKNAFDEGKKIFSKTPDDAEIIFDQIVSGGTEESLAAFRAGVAASIRSRFAKKVGGRSQFLKSLSSRDDKQAQIFRTIFPGDDIDDVIRQLDLAESAIDTKSRVLAGSQTAFTQDATKRSGSKPVISSAIEVAMNLANPFAWTRLIKNLLTKEVSDKLTPAQLEEATALLMKDNPESIKSILDNAADMESFIKRSSETLSKWQSTLGPAGVVGVSSAKDQYIPFSLDFMAVNAGTLSEEDLKRGDVNLSTYPDIVRSGEMSPEEWNASIEAENPETGLPEEDIGALSNIITNIKPNARKKILDAARLS